MKRSTGLLLVLVLAFGWLVQVNQHVTEAQKTQSEGTDPIAADTHARWLKYQAAQNGAGADTSSDAVTNWSTLHFGGEHDCQGSLRTRWSAGVLYYQFTMGPVPASAIEYNFLGVKRFVIHFYDAQGFHLDELQIGLHGMNNEPASAAVPGQFRTLSINASTNVSEDVYRRATNWKVATNIGLGERPRPTDTSGW